MTGQRTWVRACFVDLFGELRSVTVSGIDAASHLVVDASAIEGGIRVLESDCSLDLTAAARLAGPEGERLVGIVRSPDGVPSPLDTRAALAHISAELDPETRWRGIAELEWYCFDEHGDPVDDAGYFDDVVGIGGAIARAAYARLSDSGIPVLASHHEAGPGQWELDLGPLDACALADAVVLARAAVRDAAAELGATASFAARPLPGQPGSGLHLHEVLGPEVTESLIRARVGGLLDHAPGLCALAAPTVGSYRRLHAGPEAPSAALWAHEHRGALVRVATAVDGTRSIEYRGADPSANPCIAIAGIIVAAAHGAQEGSDPGEAMDEDPEGFDPLARTAAFTPLPRSLDEAVDALLADDVLVDAFDDRLIHRIVDAERALARRALAGGRDPDVRPGSMSMRVIDR